MYGVQQSSDTEDCKRTKVELACGIQKLNSKREKSDITI